MVSRPHILITDDDRLIRLTLETGLSLCGFQVTCARNGQEALQAAQKTRFDGILSDIYMPDGDGLTLLRQLRAQQPDIPILLMTAQGSVDLAWRAVEEGATDFIAKPFEIEALAEQLHRRLNARQELAPQPDESVVDYSRSGLIGQSPAMVRTYKLVAHAARSGATVLITGESGTGKELVARAIHQYSARRDKPFIAVNCAGLTDTLLESELFGHTKGAFTGAASDRGGLFEAADGGTLFLDELAGTSHSFQASLLRVLQSGESRRVGSTQARKVSVRVIGASNASVQKMVDEGSFRADLYYRLSVLTVDLPPLRERKGDIELLAQHFLRRLGGDGPALRLTSDSLQALCAYSFPGNVRELENALTRAAALAAGGVLTTDCLPAHILVDVARERTSEHAGVRELAVDWPSMDDLQRRYLILALQKVNGNRQYAADLLGLNRRTVQRLIARYNLSEMTNGDGDMDSDSEQEGE